jgi:hypothetical protein
MSAAAPVIARTASLGAPTIRTAARDRRREVRADRPSICSTAVASGNRAAATSIAKEPRETAGSAKSLGISLNAKRTQDAHTSVTHRFNLVPPLLPKEDAQHVECRPGSTSISAGKPDAAQIVSGPPVSDAVSQIHTLVETLSRLSKPVRLAFSRRLPCTVARSRTLFLAAPPTRKCRKSLILLVGGAGFEPATPAV